MKDLCELMETNDYNISYNNDINLDDNIIMGNILGFSDFLKDTDTIYDLSDTMDLYEDLDDPDDVADNFENSNNIISLKNRNNEIPIPEFEQYVQKICGIR